MLRHLVIGVIAITFIGSASNAGILFNRQPRQASWRVFGQSVQRNLHDRIYNFPPAESFSTQFVSTQCIGGSCQVPTSYTYQQQCTGPNCPLPTFTPLYSVPQTVLPTAYVPPVVVESPKPEIRTVYVERPTEPTRIEPVADNGPFFGEVSERGFKRSLVMAIRNARSQNKINARQALRLRVACNAPAFIAQAESLAVTQMAFSEDGEILERTETGEIDRTAIDWEGLASFLERLVPLLLELLSQFGA